MPSRSKIKICGITTLEDARMCRELRVDFVGLNVWEETPRMVTMRELERVAMDFQESDAPQIVIVDVSPDPKKLERIARDLAPDFFQIHGEWNGGTSIGGIPIIRAFHIGAHEDLDRCGAWSADPVLLDARREGMYGGTGSRLDPELVAGVTRPYLLAGGLNPGNVRGAVERLHPFGVDVASGVESKPGIKNRETLKAFVNAVRAA